jgi:succinate dehydrogenase hydrophobic anchor subunit
MTILDWVTIIICGVYPIVLVITALYLLCTCKMPDHDEWIKKQKELRKIK